VDDIKLRKVDKILEQQKIIFRIITGKIYNSYSFDPYCYLDLPGIA